MAEGERCLSVHEPQASLLCYGIKRFEGRGWNTHYRGRLWIHSTAKKPAAATIQVTEDVYRKLFALEGKVPVFPETYTPSALLGCVDVVDCLTAEQVEAFAPASIREEVELPYAWLCESPRLLRAPLRPMRGSLGLWRLDAALVAGAALRAPQPVGGSAFTWAALPRPADLMTRALPRVPPSARLRAWAERHGSGAVFKPARRARRPGAAPRLAEQLAGTWRTRGCPAGQRPV